MRNIEQDIKTAHAIVAIWQATEKADPDSLAIVIAKTIRAARTQGEMGDRYENYIRYCVARCEGVQPMVAAERFNLKAQDETDFEQRYLEDRLSDKKVPDA